MTVEPIDYRELYQDLLRIAMKISPTGKEQEAFSEIARQPVTPKETALNILGAISDGLKWGNWPGVNPTVSEILGQ